MVAARHLLTSYEEHLNHGFVTVLRNAEDVDIGALNLRRHLGFRDAAHRRELVADLGSALKLQPLGGGVHLAFQIADHRFGPPLQEHHDIVDNLAIFGGRAIRRARSDATVDVVIEARTGITPGDGLRAGTPREQLLDQIQCRAHRFCAGVGTEVSGAVSFHPTRDVDARPSFRYVNLQIGIVLVVFEPNVEERLMALAERRFQVEGFLLRVRHDVFKLGDLADQDPRLALQRPRGSEVGTHT